MAIEVSSENWDQREWVHLMKMTSEASPSNDLVTGFRLIEPGYLISVWWTFKLWLDRRGRGPPSALDRAVYDSFQKNEPDVWSPMGLELPSHSRSLLTVVGLNLLQEISRIDRGPCCE